MTLAIIFDSVGAGEWLVLLAVLLVVMGPRRLPSTARKIGQYYAKFRRAADSFKRQIMEMDSELEREVRESVDIEGSAEPTSSDGQGPVDGPDYSVSETGETISETGETVSETGETVSEAGESAQSEFADGNKFD